MNKYRSLPVIMLLLLAFFQNGYGQNELYPPARVEKLRIISAEAETEATNRKTEAIEFAKKNHLPVSRLLADGRIMELQYIDELGMPVYYITHNLAAAITVGTHHLYPGGNLDVSVTGGGMIAGVWDAGDVFATHSELNGRVVLKNATGTADDHATHVAGTIAAAGVQAGAKGMAYQSVIHSYDWNNYLAEVASEASSGLLVSNHSYGIVLGWNWEDNKWVWKGPAGANEDYRFGYYSNTQSRALDELAYNAPYLLMVWSAGNDRNDVGDGSKPPDGPYDCIGPEAIAKNVLAVGAVEKIPLGYTQPSDVKMTTFSSWGPSDDRRVKPDIVAPGHQVYSTVSSGGYGTKSGTSMAAPVVTGSLLLLQQLHKELHGSPMLAATLKGLVIHTAYPTGAHKGPDFEYGWGMLNTPGAASIIIGKDNFNNYIRELKLNNEEAYELDFYADGTKSIIATLSWTDIPGTPPPQVVDPPNLMLVNDLDMVITDESGNSFYPFVTEEGQTTGDNFRDNVEKIIIDNPQPRKYTLRISHKGTLTGNSQNFSLILTTSALDFGGDPVFFWIGNSGNWSDPAKWSKSTGGPPANQVPGENDHVIFDENSFSEDGQTITLTENVSGKSFSYLSKKESSFEMNHYHASVNRFFLVSSINGFYQNNGIFRITGNDSKISIVSQKYFSFEIDNPAGSTEFLTNINIDRLNLTAGNVLLKNGRFAFRSISTQGSGPVSLDLSKSTIYNEGSFDFSAANLEVLLNETEIRVQRPAGETSEITGGDLSFKKLTILSGGLFIDAALSVENIVNNGVLTLNHSSIAESLKLEAGSLLMIGGGKELAINQLQILSNPDNPVSIYATSPEPANIHFDRHLKVCFDYLDIYNVTVSGQVTLVAGLNSTLTGITTGWIANSCQNALFADFEVRFACERSRTEFIDKSSGQITQWLWDFGDPNNPEGISVAKNSIYTYQSPGIYPVSLLIQDATDQKEITREISIISNPLPNNSIIVSGDVYTSVQTAIYYQWFLNGYPIAGAISRSFTNSFELEGEFQIMLSDMICNLLSEPLLVNAGKPVKVENQISVYPNPFETTFTVEYSSDYTGTLHYQIIDMWGRILHSDRKEKYDRQLIFKENMDRLTPGIYFIRMIAGDETISRKLIKTQ